MHIVLEGLPERVQETADALDLVFPVLMTWCHFAGPGQDHPVRLEGKAAERNGRLPRPLHLTNQTLASGKAWKLSSAAVPVSTPHGVFCAHDCFDERASNRDAAADFTADR